jgi:branched-subunit amino acid aminotransferase/4-amino-4-deoxychorismate lyase
MDPLSPSFAHGVGLFETMRLKARQLFFFQRHWQRMEQSARQLGLKLVCDPQAVIASIRALVVADQLEDACIKLALIEDANAGSQLFVYARPCSRAPDSVALYYAPDYPLNAHSQLAGHKTHNYMEHRLLHDRARKLGYYDQIRVNTDGAIAETTLGNLFLVQGGSVITPAEDTGLLPGVVRRLVLSQSSLEVQIDVSLDAGDLYQAEAIFLTNSAVGILPVHAIGSRELPDHSICSASHPLVLDLKRKFASWQKSESVSFRD